MVGYMFAKKNSIHSLAISLARRPGVGDSVGLHGGLLIPFNRLCTLAERLVCLCVSRSSLMTFALEPLGPFFCGIALYVQVSCAEAQLRHGLMPSHLTLRRWQASQALFTACDILASLSSICDHKKLKKFPTRILRRRRAYFSRAQRSTFCPPIFPLRLPRLFPKIQSTRSLQGSCGEPNPNTEVFAERIWSEAIGQVLNRPVADRKAEGSRSLEKNAGNSLAGVLEVGGRIFDG